MSITLNSPLIDFPTVGKTTVNRLKKLGLQNTKDLFFYYPNRYEDLSKIYPINEINSEGTVTIKAKLDLINSRRAHRRRMNITEALVSDNTGSLKIIWFNQPYLKKNLTPGEELYFSGNIKQDKYGLHLSSPTYEKSNTQTTHTARITPIYPTTAGLTQKQIRFFIKHALENIKISEHLPETLLKKYNLLDLNKSLHQIHFPDSFENLEKARKRLQFDELFILQLYAQQAKQNLNQQNAISLEFKEKEIKQFVKSLPFTLTDDQKKSAWQILQNISQDKPMNRLLEGDVGSGKTIVAALAMLNCALNGYQSVLMAPTEILAQQHYKTLKQILPKQKISLLTRTHRQISVDSKIFVGTHALIQQKINFANLALAIIDEQHRFGVGQRKTLKEKSGDSQTIPHLLSLTATPIPRSLALTVYGDLDLSIIKTKPQGRKKIITKIITEQKRFKAYQFIKEKIEQKQQIFVVCPLISPSDKLGVKSVEEEYERLNKDIFPDLKIRLLHGKLKPKEKEKIMTDFQKNKFPILVSTSVIEVGVDIPGATIMMIEGADRFGLAQLHQFRGRVGRNDQQSYCFLFTDSNQPKTLARLNALVKSNDGFSLAEFDLQLRGPGDVYGQTQSGYINALKLANLGDHILIKQTQEAAKNILPELSSYNLLQEKLNNFIQNLHLE